MPSSLRQQERALEKEHDCMPAAYLSAQLGESVVQLSDNVRIVT